MHEKRRGTGRNRPGLRRRSRSDRRRGVGACVAVRRADGAGRRCLVGGAPAFAGRAALRHGAAGDEPVERSRCALRSGGHGGRHPSDHWTREPQVVGNAPRGACLAGLWPVETFFFLNNQAGFVLRSLCRPALAVALPLGGRARRPHRALHHLWRRLVPSSGHEVAARGAAKLRKIKHLQRKRGATDYRGQSAGRDFARRGPSTGSAPASRR